jgi:hypothetical protein
VPGIKPGALTTRPQRRSELNISRSYVKKKACDMIVPRNFTVLSVKEFLVKTLIILRSRKGSISKIKVIILKIKKKTFKHLYSAFKY